MTMTPDAYADAVPSAAQPMFDELRTIVRNELPEFHEVVSYGVIGYKRDIKKRVQIFISGWKDHVAMYPIPRDPELHSRLDPFIKGKGTLRFSLTAPLPHELIIDTIKALSS